LILLFGAKPESFLIRRLVLVSGHEPQGAQLFVGVDAASSLRVTPGRLPAGSGRAFPVAGLGDPSEVARVDTNSRVISKAAIIIAALALLLGAVVVINTMAMAVIERRREFGALAAIGLSRLRITRLILGETMAVSLAGPPLVSASAPWAASSSSTHSPLERSSRPTSASGSWGAACSSGSRSA
jgi:hypothetical protein